jgi:hypothetical protein
VRHPHGHHSPFRPRLSRLLVRRRRPCDHPPRRGPGRPRGSTKATATAARESAPARKPSGRLARRSPSEIAKTLGSIVALLKGKKAGLRSEQIRAALKLDVRELPRVLHEGLKTKKLKSKGQKRATQYSVA